MNVKIATLSLENLDLREEISALLTDGFEDEISSSQKIPLPEPEQLLLDEVRALLIRGLPDPPIAPDTTTEPESSNASGYEAATYTVIQPEPLPTEDLSDRQTSADLGDDVSRSQHNAKTKLTLVGKISLWGTIIGIVTNLFNLGNTIAANRIQDEQFAQIMIVEEQENEYYQRIAIAEERQADALEEQNDLLRQLLATSEDLPDQADAFNDLVDNPIGPTVAIDEQPDQLDASADNSAHSSDSDAVD